MGSNLLQSFLGDALQHVPRIRRVITAVSEGSDLDLAAAYADLTAISSQAKEQDQVEIAEFADAIGVELRRGSFGNAISLLSKLEASILRAMLEDESFSLDIDGFAASEAASELFSFSFEPDSTPTTEQRGSFEIFTEENRPEVPQGDEISSAVDEFEVDPELLEIFAEEADELLRNIDASLDSLANDRNDSDSLWEIRRNAHTFKGSAGIVGLKQLSEVAHRVEDLLDRLAETKYPANDQVLDLLHGSTRCLKSLVAGDSAETLSQTISGLYSEFDVVLAALSEQPIVSAVAAQVVQAEVEIETLEVPVSVEPTVSLERSDDLDQTILDRLFGTDVIEQVNIKAAPSRSVIRVSLERLDELVRIVRDMLIGRSVYEQNLKSLERQIDDLHNATRRLQTTSTKLEIDFEASMMGSGSSALTHGGLPAQSTQGSFDELEFDRYTEFHQSTRELTETTSDAFSINASLDLLRGGFESVYDEQRRLIDELQEWLLHVRMVEFGTLAPRLQRAVRVTCDEEGKQAELRITNESLEVDTQILDSLIEPLMHLLKNSVAHGIENAETRRLMDKPEVGSIDISVENDETHIVLRISDDGRGISPQAVKEKAVSLGQITADEAERLSDEEVLELIFLQGLSTAEKLNLSAGRGVGMSIVKESISAARGTIAIESTSHKGTTFVVRMPLALAVTKVLLTRVSGRTYALPIRHINHVAELTDDVFAGIDGKKVDLLGKKLPLHQLPVFLGHEPVEPSMLLGKAALLFETTGRSCAIAVEEVLTTEEIVIKPLARPLDKINGLLGAAILGSGELVPILDVPALLRKTSATTFVPSYTPRPQLEKQPWILIVDDSPSVRHMTSKVVQSAGWTAKTAKDGLDALEQLKAAEDLPTVILSDIEMPRMDGYEFAASLQRDEKLNKIPVIMITSRTAEKHREKALESGVSQYLTKPYEDRELIDSIKVLASLT